MIEVQDINGLTRHIRQGASTGVWGYEEKDGVKLESGPCHARVMGRLAQKRPFKWFASASAYGPKSATYKQHSSVARIDNQHFEGHAIAGGDEVSKSKNLYSHVQDYLRWLCSPESPYRSIHKNDIQLIEDEEKNVRGFILGSSVFDENCNYSSILNFCIANRMVRDYAGYFGRYGALKEELGLSTFEAFILMPYFSFREGIWVRTTNTWDGAHLPLSEGYTYAGRKGCLIDLKRLRDSRPNFSNDDMYSNSQIWRSEFPAGEKELSSRIKEGTSVKTRFSSISKFEAEDIIKFAKELFA